MSTKAEVSNSPSGDGITVSTNQEKDNDSLNHEQESDLTNQDNDCDHMTREVAGADKENIDTDMDEGNMSRKHDNDDDTMVDELADASIDFSSDPAKMSPDVRIKIYECGQELERRGKNIMALKCYLRSLSGLNNQNDFPYMSACLRQVAQLYYSMEEYEKAVQFIQAEKVYHESAIIDNSQEDFSLIYENGCGERVNQDDPDAKPIDVLRAQEYQCLSKLCLAHEQPQMSLEYIAKATKLRQKLLGNEHPTTKKSMVDFTLMYGETGKKEYSDNMKKCSDLDSAQTNGEATLRHRKQNKEEINKSMETDISPERQTALATGKDPDNLSMEAFLIVLFLVCLVMLFGAGFYLYCRIDSKSTVCSNINKLIDYCYFKLWQWVEDVMISR